MPSKTAVPMSIRSQSIDSPLETSRPALSLLFQPDDPTRTDIIDGNTGHLYYSVDTIKQRKYQLTLVRRAASPIDGPSTVGEETTVASFEWHRYRSDMISFGDNMPIPVKDWLKRSMNPFNTYVSHAFSNERDCRLTATVLLGLCPSRTKPGRHINGKGTPLVYP